MTIHVPSSTVLLVLPWDTVGVHGLRGVILGFHLGDIMVIPTIITFPAPIWFQEVGTEDPRVVLLLMGVVAVLL